MFHIFHQSSRRMAFGIPIAVLALLFAFVSLGLGQGAQPVPAPGGVGSTQGDFGMGAGSHAVKGKVHLGDGAALGSHQFKVTISSADSTSQDTRTDADGNFAFHSLTAGNYTVTVEGLDDYETSREYVQIDRATGGPVTEVTVFLRRKPGSDPAFAGVPKDAIDAYSKGMEALEKNDEKKAQEQFEKAITAYPNFGQALAQLGTIYLHKNDLAKAMEFLQKAATVKPDDFDARYNYGYALFYKPDYAAAEPELREAIKLGAMSALAHNYLGLTLVHLKKYDEARTELDKAVNLPNGDKLAQAHKFLGGLYMNSDPKRAADELEKYVALNPKDDKIDQIKQTIKDLRAKAGG